RGLDPGEHRARPVARVERELQELVRAVDVLGFDDFRDAEVELVEIIVGDDSLSRCRRRGRGCGHGCFLTGINQRVELFFLDAGYEVGVWLDIRKWLRHPIKSQRLTIQKRLGSCRKTRENWLEPARYKLKAANADRTDVVQLLPLSGVFGEFPRSGSVEV